MTPGRTCWQAVVLACPPGSGCAPILNALPSQPARPASREECSPHAPAGTARRRRQLDPLADPVDKAAPDVVLERLDCVAHGGLREIQVFGSQREATAPRDRGKGIELAAVDDWFHPAGGEHDSEPVRWTTSAPKHAWSTELKVCSPNRPGSSLHSARRQNSRPQDREPEAGRAFRDCSRLRRSNRPVARSEARSRMGSSAGREELPHAFFGGGFPAARLNRFLKGRAGSRFYAEPQRGPRESSTSASDSCRDKFKYTAPRAPPLIGGSGPKPAKPEPPGWRTTRSAPISTVISPIV